MLRPSILGESLFDDFFDDFFAFPAFDDREIQKAQKKLYGHHGVGMMKTDVREHDNHYEVDIDLPGFKKEDLSLELKNGCLMITAAKGLDQNEQDQNNGKFIRRERYAGAMSRSFYVGDELKQEDVRASYENGVLKICVPKLEKKAPAIEADTHISIEG